MQNVKVDCPICSRKYSFDLTYQESARMYQWAVKRILIQDALPDRTPYERELIRYAFSGLPIIACCKECENEFWGNDEE